VVHPGARGEAQPAQAVRTIIEGVKQASKRVQLGHLRILIENTAGMGSAVGARLEEVGAIVHGLTELGVGACLDTAHLFAAGYDIGSESGVKKTFREFDRVIGRNCLVAIHVNDSKTGRGSRVDRHEHIGKGRIGLDAFRFIMRSSRFRKIPKVLETPKGKDMREDVQNLNTLRSLLNS